MPCSGAGREITKALVKVRKRLCTSAMHYWRIRPALPVPEFYNNGSNFSGLRRESTFVQWGIDKTRLEKIRPDENRAL